MIENQNRSQEMLPVGCYRSAHMNSIFADRIVLACTIRAKSRIAVQLARDKETTCGL
jgi:hypothetical protein